MAVRGLRFKPLLCVVGLGAALLLAVTGGAGWVLYQRLDGNIRTDDETARALATDHGSRPRAVAHGAENILLLGSDREGNYGGERSDTTILLHLSADHRSASLVSVPRDMMVDIPSCLRPDGTRSPAQYAQFNWAFQFGGAACAIRAFEKLTGVRVDHHLVVDFTGFEKVVDAVGGVEVEVHEPMSVPDSTVELSPGRQLLRGDQALVFVRARTGTGDGSDLQRIERQKEFIDDLLRELRGSGTLTDPTRLYPVLNAVTSSLVADRGLDSLGELNGLVERARGIPAKRTSLVTIPCDPRYRGGYMMVEDQAEKLFKALREDKPLPKRLYNAYDKTQDEL
ncbi:LCP family protein [Streptomyces sp. NPDC006540]|jgi:LCP family protein required for cell wall assembly|uniref:LCP family protein n=1 Tax=Streptomyces sp. NPDC006540 TaxID=3155353 RepID=UPI0033A2D5B9